MLAQYLLLANISVFIFLFYIAQKHNVTNILPYWSNKMINMITNPVGSSIAETNHTAVTLPLVTETKTKFTRQI